MDLFGGNFGWSILPSDEEGTIVITPDSQVCISPLQRVLHIAFEAAAVLVVAPFMFYMAQQKNQDVWVRVLAAIAGTATVVVDGLLLLTYLLPPTSPTSPT